jgi:hypothetical protein
LEQPSLGVAPDDGVREEDGEHGREEEGAEHREPEERGAEEDLRVDEHARAADALLLKRIDRRVCLVEPEPVEAEEGGCEDEDDGQDLPA